MAKHEVKKCTRENRSELYTAILYNKQHWMDTIKELFGGCTTIEPTSYPCIIIDSDFGTYYEPIKK